MNRFEPTNSKPKSTDAIDSLMASHIFPHNMRNQTKQNGIDNSSDDEVHSSEKSGSASRYKQLTEDVIREHYLDLQKVSTPSQIKVLEKQLPWNLPKQPPQSALKSTPTTVKNVSFNFQNYTPYTKGVSMFVEAKPDSNVKITTNSHYVQRKEPNITNASPNPPPPINIKNKPSSNSPSTLSPSNSSPQTIQNLYTAKQKLSSDMLEDSPSESKRTVKINSKAQKHVIEDTSSDTEDDVVEAPSKNHIKFFYSSALRKEIQSPPQRERLRQKSAPSTVHRDQLSLLKARAKSTLFADTSDEEVDEDSGNMMDSFEAVQLPKKPGTAAILRTPVKEMEYSPSRYASTNNQFSKASNFKPNENTTSEKYEFLNTNKSNSVKNTNLVDSRVSFDGPSYKNNNNTPYNNVQEKSKSTAVVANPTKMYADVKSRVDSGIPPSNSGGKSESTSIFEALLAKATQDGAAFSETGETIAVEEDVDLRECEFCERKFRADIINKHKNFCRKNQNKVVKQFDMKLQRAVKDDNGNIISNLHVDDKPAEVEKKTVPIWKMQSEQLRRATNPTTEVTAAPVLDDRVQCEVCGRKFKAEVHERHIKVCKVKAKDVKTKVTPNNNTSLTSSKIATRK